MVVTDVNGNNGGKEEEEGMVRKRRSEQLPAMGRYSEKDEKEKGKVGPADVLG